MKKILVLFLITAGFGISIHAQEIGARFGDVTGGNVALDAVFATGKFNRIHADVSFGHGGVGVDALWDFVYKPLGNLPLSWYAGVGPTVFLASPVLVAAASELGVEHKIKDVPISISADWRPTLVIIETTDFHFGLFGVNVRYVF